VNGLFLSVESVSVFTVGASCFFPFSCQEFWFCREDCLVFMVDIFHISLFGLTIHLPILSCIVHHASQRSIYIERLVQYNNNTWISPN
jgi:hypothetical protein